MSPFCPFEDAPHIAVGVSGGSDSLALTLLLHDWVQKRGGKILALTVDHGLRPESAQEAADVATLLAARGIAHKILRWKGDKPQTRIQERARAARLSLLLDECKQQNILHLALAHTQDDQAETVMLRLRNHSGADGLAGIAPERITDDARIIRPLLDTGRETLKATCGFFKAVWIDDPSNEKTEFTRIEIRKKFEAGDCDGYTRDQVLTLAAEKQKTRAHNEKKLSDLMVTGVEVFPEGYARLDWRVFENEPTDMKRRVLKRLLQTLSGEPYPARHDSIDTLIAKIETAEFKGATLSGCEISPHKDRLLVTRELNAIKTPTLGREGVLKHAAQLEPLLDVIPKKALYVLQTPDNGDVLEKERLVQGIDFVLFSPKNSLT